MPTIQEIRAKFPQYNDMSDDALAEGLHKKYYSDMPFGEFAGKIGYRRNWSDMPGQAVESAPGNAGEMAQGFGQLIMHPADTLGKVGELAAGGIDNLVGMGMDAVGIDRGMPSPEQAGRRGAASTVGANVKDTLTTAEGFKHYIAKSPVSAVTDAATVLAGGATVAPRIAGRVRGATLPQRLRNAPSAEDVASLTKEKFDAIAAKDAQLPVDKFLPAREKLGRFLEDQSIDAMDAPHATRQFNRMNEMGRPLQAPPPSNDMWGNRVVHPVPEETRTIPFNKLESIRRGAGRVERAPNFSDTATTDKMVAGKIKKTIDSYYDDAADPALKGEIEAAREMGRRNILAKQIKEMVRQGEEYRSGAESGIGNKFSSYLKSEKGKGLTPEERKAFRKTSRREGVAGAISTAGNGLGKIALAMLGATGGPKGVAAAFGAHLTARKIAEALVRNAAKKAEKTVLIGRDAQKAGSQASKELRLERLTKALLALEASQ